MNLPSTEVIVLPQSMLFVVDLGPVRTIGVCTAAYSVFTSEVICFPEVFGKPRDAETRLFIQAVSRSYLTCNGKAYRRYRLRDKLSTKKLNETISYFKKLGWNIIPNLNLVGR